MFVVCYVFVMCIIRYVCVGFRFQRRCHGDGEMNGDDCRLSDGDSSVCSESASEQEEDGEMGEEKMVRSNRKHYREQAGSFSGMSDAKSRFEGGMTRREMLREERKGELTRLRDMICGVSAVSVFFATHCHFKMFDGAVKRNVTETCLFLYFHG